MEKEPGQPLFQEFPSVDTETWMEKIIADLKGADFEKKLVWRSDEGFRVKPFYRSEDLEEISYLVDLGTLKTPGSTPNSWILCQEITQAGDPEKGNKSAAEAIAGGAGALRFPWIPSLTGKPEYLSQLLKGIRFDQAGIYFNGNLEADAIYTSLSEVVSGLGTEPSVITGCLGADPLGVMAASGTRVLLTENIGKLVRNVQKQSPGLRIINVNGAMIQDAGANLVQELGLSLSMANEYLHTLTRQGMDPADAARSVQLTMATGPEYFLEMAKLRAARILWDALCEGYGLDSGSSPLFIHSVNAHWNMTLFDPHVNLLRGTTEAMASVLGGADMVTVLPHDLRRPGNRSFSDRMARNIQNILREEAYLQKVADPASGSYYVEKLTDFIADGAWKLFRETESQGGFIKALEKGQIQDRIDESRKSREEKIASGRFSLLGTNAYPNAKEEVLPVLETDEPDEQAQHDPDPQFRPVKPFLASEEFDRIRLQTESSGRRPRVFLFKFGNPGWATARANFASNFFSCAGYEISDPPVQKRIDVGIDQAVSTGADLVVLCSADETYPEFAKQVADALGPKTLIVVAGQPGNMKDELEKDGVNDFIHIKVNLLSKLKEFNKILLSQKPGTN